MIFGVLFNLVPIFIVGFGLWILVKREYMEQEKTMSVEERGNEKVNPAFHMFLYLSKFFSLGFLIGGLLTTLFQFINKLIPDTSFAEEFRYTSSFDDAALKVGISMLLISALVYFSVAFLTNRKLANQDIRSDSVVRKFITYIALFVLVAISIGSLATLVYNYLSGDITGNLFLKIIAFFAVNASFAYFYFWEIRRKDFSKGRYEKIYYLALGLVALVLISGFFIGDSPQVTREKKIDESRLMDVQNMNSNVEMFFNNNNRLPKPEEIEKSTKFPTIEYKVTGEKTYELCAEFSQSREKVDFYSKQWNHPAGVHCFELNIDERQSKGEFSVPIEVAK